MQISSVAFLQRGVIDTSILVAVGVHAKLEEISEDGCWLKDRKFSYGGVDVDRKAGDKVAQVMWAWRELRREHPELFADKYAYGSRPQAT